MQQQIEQLNRALNEKDLTIKYQKEQIQSLGDEATKQESMLEYRGKKTFELSSQVLNTQKTLTESETKIMMLQADIGQMKEDHKVEIDDLHLRHGQQKANLESDHKTQLANLA